MKSLLFLMLLSFLFCLPGAIAQKKAPAPKKSTATKKPVVAKKTVPAKTTETLPTESEVKSAYKKGEYSKAISLAEERLAKYPGNKVMLVAQALSYGMLRNHELVLKTVDKIYPGNDTAAIFLASMPFSMSKEIRKSDAVWYIEQAHKVNPRSSIVYLMEASYLMDDSSFDKAKNAAIAGSALLTEQEGLDIKAQYASMLQASGAKDQGYELINSLRKKHPGDTVVLSQYYSMLLKDKRYTESLAELNNLMKLKTESDKRLRKERAFLYEEMGRHDDACNEASQLTREDDDYFYLQRKLNCADAFVNMLPALTKSYTYEVDSHGMRYQFIVKPKSIRMDEVAAFDWSMTIRPDMKGSVVINKGALDTAHGQMNKFTAGDIILDKLTSVWVSNSVYNDLKKTGKTTIEASDDGPKLFGIVLDDSDNEPTVKTPGGTTKALRTLHLRSEDEKEEIWINDDPANPMITHMEIGWSIELTVVD